MAQFQRKFQIGNRVVLSSAKTNHEKMFLNGVFTVVGYAKGDSAPYQIRNNAYRTFWVTASQISPEVVKSEDDDLDTYEFKKPEKKEVKRVDFGQVALKELGFSIGDTVRVDFIPTTEMCSSLNLHSDIVNHLKQGDAKHFSQYVGKSGHVVQVNKKGYLRVRFEDNDSEWLSMIGLTILDRPSMVVEFQASSSRTCEVFTNHVFIDEHRYSFETFENFYTLVKEHLKQHKTGEDRRFTLPEGNYRTGLLRNSCVEVGCQSFTYKNVKRLMAAIRFAKTIK